MQETVLRHATVYDGTENCHGFRADVAMAGGRITQVGVVEGDAHCELDATGMAVLPGMIDAHCHEDLMLLRNRQHAPSLSQGVTTLVVGVDGLAYAPLAQGALRDYAKYLAGLNGPLDEDHANFSSFSGYLRKFGQTGPHVCAHVSHGALRLAVLRFVDAPLRGRDLDKAKELLRQALVEGAVGFSTGLSYFPCAYADAEEMTELCKVAAEFDVPFTIHLRTVFRGERFDPTQEAIDIARRSGCRLHFSHRRTGPQTAGQVDALCAPLEQALAEGIRITADTYPFHAGSGHVVYMLPGWAVEGGTEKTLARLADPAQRERIAAYTENMGYPNLYEAVFTHAPRHPHILGRTFAAVAAERGQSVGHMLCDLLLAEELELGHRDGDLRDTAVEAQLERDLADLLRKPYYMIGSDGITCHELPHPRAYSSFTKYLRIAREQNVPLGTVAHRAAALPAQLFGLCDRGRIAPGMHADLVVLRPDAVRELATFQNPRRMGEGIEYVFVGGKLAVDNGKCNGVLAGRALRR